MPSEERNIGASVRARLLKRSRAENSDYQVLLTRYALERLLYRLGVSQFREAFVLKGEIDYPTLLDLPAPHLRVYPVETVIAEKLNAMVTLGIANSRLKDYYDLWLISKMFSFQKPLPLHAILRTFERRGSRIPVGTPTGLTDQFATEWAVQWRAFIKRERMRGAPEELGVLIDNLRLFLVPLLGPGHGETAYWQPGGPWKTDSIGPENV